jgi:predicted RNA-binding Zn-ribbon protein involved in translation (DUF1610 family)
MMASKIKCPECGAEMNHHADKLVEPTSAAEAVNMSASLGGVVAEYYTCPSCGWSEERRVFA